LIERTSANLDYAAVRAYWEEAAQEAESASYMAHEQGLPASCVEHRFALERAWSTGGSPDWNQRPRCSTSLRGRGVDRAVRAALRPSRRRRRKRWHARRSPARLAGQGNVELVWGDARTVNLDGEFQGVLLGGLLMYLDRADAIDLLVPAQPACAKRSDRPARIGHPNGVEVKAGPYQVVYRSVQEYESMAAEAGLRVVAVERNRGYAHMEIAVALVDFGSTLATARPVWCRRNWRTALAASCGPQHP